MDVTESYHCCWMQTQQQLNAGVFTYNYTTKLILSQYNCIVCTVKTHFPWQQHDQYYTTDYSRNV